jgi:iron complex transport system substrate-binding protein
MILGAFRAIRKLPRFRGRAAVLLILSLLSAAYTGAARAICVTDDAQRQLCLDQPAKRIVSLSPGATELLFAAGAGDRIVATVSHSDYPEAAQALPRIGKYDRIDLEALVAQEPDLVVGWNSGNPDEQLRRIETLDLALYRSEPRRFTDVASTLIRFGELAGTQERARKAAKAFREQIARLRDRYANADPVRVFYQVWPDPLMTVNNDHLIGRTIRLCGGKNIFGDLDSLTPRVNREAVLERNPEAIVAGGMGETDRSWLEPWRAFDHLKAVQKDNLFFVPPSTIQRPTPRLVQGARRLCRKLEVAREHRG